ncbi:kinesin-like protein KIN-7D [Citrus sinensis]|nr:kinesin-like protein KIN-7D [Citrus sinensis]
MHESIKCAGAGTVVDPIHHRHSPLLQPLLADAETEKTKLAPRLLVISQFTNNIFVESGTGKSHPSHGKLSSSPTVQSSRRLLFGSDPTSPCEVTDTFSSPPPPPPSPSILFFTNLFASSRLRVAESTQLNTMASSSRARSSSPFSYRKPVTPYSSTSSTSSSFMNNRLMPRSCSTSASSYFNSGNGLGSRSMTPSRSCSDSMYNSPRGYSARAAPPVIFPSEELMAEPLDAPQRSGDSISVTIRFRPLSEREFQRGDEIAWYADGDKIVRNEYNPATAYAFDRVFGPHANSQEVYDVAARPVVKAAMEGVNGTVFAYGVTSSGKTHTMHGDHNSPGIIPLAIKDVFSIIQDVINDLLDPTGQNLRVREDAQGTYVEGIKEEVVLSPGHALSFIAAGEEHRHVGSNNFNLLSSRSHTIFTLNLIDLAGSESSKTETTGLRRKEGSYINKSLLTLGTVIGKLSEGKASHVPYRDSKLTRLLQSSLSGHGHVSLICTVTPASSSMEETHNTLKFASRAKRVEIYASRNKIIDEKSLIKKYQREISSLKEELDQLKRGILVGVSHEELMTLRQKLEEGQVKMQSRLEEEEEAKAALMSRIQRLTKLILVSTKNTIPGLSDVPNHQRSHSVGEDDLDLLREGSLLLDGENQKDSTSSASGLASDLPSDFKHRRSSSKWNEEFSPTSSTVTESTQAGELISGSKHPIGGMTSDQMDLLVEQVKMLAGEIAFSSSNLKRLVDQSVNDPDGSKVQIQNLEREIQEKRRQMRILEQRIIENGEASMANASMVDMQQTVTRLMSQCNEKAFELEIKSADNRILQEQLQNKCSENKKLQEKVNLLEQQLACQNGDKSAGSSGQGTSDEYVDELRKKVQSQETENEKLKLEHVQLSEENSGLHVQNQKLAEEASYAKELASAAAVELKNLAGEVTKISLQNAKLEKELLAARESMHSRGAAMQTVNGVNRKYSDGMKAGRKGRLSGRSTEISGVVSDDFDSWNLDPDDLKLELQARKQREAALEAALAEKEFLEDEYRKKVEESKRREEALENDLANMWVLVAKLKKEVGSVPELSTVERQRNGEDCVCDPKANETDCNTVLKDRHFLEVSKPADENSVERQVLDVPKPADETPKEEPLVARLKCVNLVRLLVQSVQFVVQRFQIGFLHSLDRAIHALKMEGLLSFASLAFSVQQRVQFFY